MIKKEQGKRSAYAFQKIKNLENRVLKDFLEEQQNDNFFSTIRMQNQSCEADDRKVRQEMMRGHYNFKFPSNVRTMNEKIQKIAVEPTAFHLYKRGDLVRKINLEGREDLKRNKLYYNAFQNAKKDKLRNKLEMLGKKILEGEVRDKRLAADTDEDALETLSGRSITEIEDLVNKSNQRMMRYEKERTENLRI